MILHARLKEPETAADAGRLARGVDVTGVELGTC